jgi:hypothetical protein
MQHNVFEAQISSPLSWGQQLAQSVVEAIVAAPVVSGSIPYKHRNFL